MWSKRAQTGQDSRLEVWALKKRAQTASGAAILIVVIAVMIMLYILLLQPQDRAALLGEKAETGGGPAPTGTQPGDRNVRQGFQTAPGDQIILQQTVGLLYPEGSSLLDHALPSFTIFTKSNAQALKSVEHAYVKNGLFGEKKYNTSFMYDKRGMSNAMLSFVAEEYDGTLRVIVNGETVFEREIKSPTPPPIRLPDEYLLPNNQLVLETNSPGAAVWRTHEFSLRNMMISADVKDLETSTAEHHFTLPENEYEHLAYLELSFMPNCDPNLAGKLYLRVNGRPLSSSYPECGEGAKLQISRELLNQGDNILHFISEQSSYLIDSVNLRTILSSSINPTFYFNLPMELYVALGGQMGGYQGQGGQGQYPDQYGGGYPGGGYQGQGGYPGGGYPGGYGGGYPSAGAYPGGNQGGAMASLVLTVRFADATNQKVLTLNVNGFQNTIETTDLSYSTLIPPQYLIDGSNSVQLIPQGSPLEVAELRVEVQQAS